MPHRLPFTLMKACAFALLAGIAWTARSDARNLLWLAAFAVPLAWAETVAAGLLMLLRGPDADLAGLVPDPDGQACRRRFMRRIMAPFDEPSDRAATAVLVALTLLAASLRALHWDLPAISFDEGATWRFGGGNPFRLLSGIAGEDCHPPLFYLVQWASETLLGRNLYGLRLPTLVCSTLCVPAVYALGRRLFRRKGPALLAAALLAIHPYHIYLGRYLRMYSLLILLALLAQGAFVDWLERRPGAERRLAGWLALALLTHYMAVWLVATLILAALAVSGRAAFRDRMRPLFAAARPWTLPLAAWGLFAAWHLVRKGALPLTYWLAHDSVRVLAETLSRFDWAESASLVPLFIALVTSPLALALPPFRTREHRLLIVFTWAPLALNWLTSLVFSLTHGTGTYQPNHVAYILPAIGLILASLATAARARLAVALGTYLVLARPLVATLDKYAPIDGRPFFSHLPWVYPLTGGAVANLLLLAALALALLARTRPWRGSTSAPLFR